MLLQFWCITTMCDIMVCTLEYSNHNSLNKLYQRLLRLYIIYSMDYNGLKFIVF